MSLQVQAMTMLAMFVGGSALGIMYDAYRIIAGQIRLWRWLRPVCDVLYWVLATVFVFHLLMTSNQGEVRLYIFIGLLIGVGFYYYTASAMVVRLIRLLLALIDKTVQVIAKVLEWLIVRPVRLICHVLVVLAGFLGAISIFFYKIVLQWTKLLWAFIRWLYNLLSRWIAFFRKP